MKTVVLYDSWYGNTEAVAQTVAKVFGSQTETCSVRYAANLDFDLIDLLIVGSPTHGGTATPPLMDYLDRLSPEAFNGVKVAAFDTRSSLRWTKLLGYASKRLLRQMEERGATGIAPPAGFYVDGRHGPLRSGEIERAKTWALLVESAARRGVVHNAYR